MLPITRVVLFKHGVAYYQREGKVSGDQVIHLAFKAEQMNDVLKSLTTLDFGGGHFAALSYDSEEPIERRLAEYNIHIPAKGAITAFLDQLKGVNVSIEIGGEKVSGSVVGMEDIIQGKDASVRKPHLAILTEHSALCHLPLHKIRELAFTDAHVQRQLLNLMETLAASLHKGQKRLSIQAVGQGEREVSIAYVVESPVWKTSYRLVSTEGEESSALLQGWALVDNTTEEDWEGIELSLVAGLPISFVHDLYTPRYRQRPVIEVEQETAVAPPVVESGEAWLDAETVAPPAAPVATTRRKSLALTRSLQEDVPLSVRWESVAVSTRTQEMGDLFSYDITQPVDIGQGRSALVPILQSTIETRKILFYNAEIREKNPMSSFQLHNTTGLTLEGGPITVFEGNNYVGEAMLDTLRDGAEKIVPYSVELGVTIASDIQHREKSFTHITRKGVSIHKHYRKEKVTRYRIKSNLKQNARLLLDHRFEYALGDEKPAELMEVTDSYWRYRLDLEAGKIMNFEVVEVYRSYDSLALAGITHKEIDSLMALNLISGVYKSQLEKIAELCAQRAHLGEQRDKKKQLLEEVGKGQERLRKNIDVLGNSREEERLRLRYVTKLADEEDRIEALAEELNTVNKEIEALTEQVELLMERLTPDTV